MFGPSFCISTRQYAFGNLKAKDKDPAWQEKYKRRN